VEHDEETIRSADWIVDLGPGAGEHGGKVIAEGPVQAILDNPNSLTGAYLSRRLTVPMPKKRRLGNGKHLTIVGANANNLKNLTVDIPLGKLVCITGVSGSGKSTLMVDVLYEALARELNRAHTNPGGYKRIEGIDNLDKIINIDQSPSAAHRVPTRAPTPASGTRSVSCSPSCRKVKCAGTPAGVSRSTCTAGDAKPARAMANCASKCSSCRMCTYPATCVTVRASTVKHCRSNIKVSPSRTS
jgi:hypothetical protein